MAVTPDFAEKLEDELRRQMEEAARRTQGVAQLEGAIRDEMARLAQARQARAEWVSRMLATGISPEDLGQHPVLASLAEFLSRPARAFMQTPVGQFIERSSEVAGPTLLFQQPEPTATTGNPIADAIADLVGQTAGTLGQFAVAQGTAGAALQGLGQVPQLARIASLAPTALQTAGRGAATGAALSGLQAAFSPEPPTLEEAARNIAFFGGANLGSALAQQALRAARPGIAAVPEALAVGAAGGAAGALAASPFTDAESLPEFLKDVAVDTVALGIMHGAIAAITPQSPTGQFVRSMRQAAKELERAQRASQAGDQATVNAAYRNYWENIRNAWHFGVQAGEREVGARLPADAAIRFDMAFQRATQRAMQDVTPTAPGLPPGMARQVMQRAREIGPENMQTVEQIQRQFPSMSRQRAQAALEQIVRAHDFQAQPTPPQLPAPQAPVAPPAPSPAAPPAPQHRFQAVADLAERLRSEGRLPTRTAPVPEAPTSPQIDRFQRRLERAEQLRQPQPQPNPVEAIRQRIETQTQPIEPTERQLEILPGPFQVVRTPGRQWAVMNTDTREFVSAPNANYFMARGEAERRNEAIPIEARRLQGGFLPGQTVYDPRGRALTVIDNAGNKLVRVQAPDGRRFNIGINVLRTEPPQGVAARPVPASEPEPLPPSTEPEPVPTPRVTAPPETSVEVPGRAEEPAQAQREPGPIQAAPAAQETPQTPVREPVARGTTSTAATERGTEVQTEWAIVEAPDLITSHDTSLRPNAAFPRELQPRDRTRAASELQISRLVNTLRPEFLAESPSASQGAPIVGPDMIVESGNARTIALKRAYEQNASGAEQYRQFLIENAGRFGLDPEAIRQAQAPVLVRIRQSDVDRRQFVVEANEGSVAAMSATEQAMSDAERMSPDLIAMFQPGEDGEIVTPSNREFISAFMQRIASPSERGRLLDAAGRPSQEGINRIRNAVFARAYGDASALAQLAESTDSNVRNITGGMLIAAPRMVDIKEGIRRGELFDLDPTSDIAVAMRKMSELRAQGTPVDVYLQQATMFEDDLSALAKDFLQVFETYKRSRTKISRILRTYADLVEAAGNPNQETLFGGDRAPDPANILQAAINKVEAGYDPRTPQTSLFEGQPAPGADFGESAGEVAPQGGRPASVPRAPAGEIRGFPATAEAPARVAHERPAHRTQTERVITRKEAIDFIEKEFMMPIREGRMRLRGARGEFNLRTHVTRLRRAEDFRAITHEFGHFLSETLPLTPENYPELQPLGARLYPDAPADLQREEGNAEFFYLYLSRPDEAKAAAPSYFTDFEALLAKNPDLARKVRELQRMTVSLFNQTGTAAIKAAIVREDAKDRPFLTPVQRFYSTWIDDLHPIWVAMKYILGDEKITSEWDVQVSQNPYMLGRLARGRTRKANVLLTRHQISPDFERVGPSFQEILRPVSGRIEDFEAYLVARRAIELHERGIDPGVRRADAEAAVRELETPEFRRAQEQLVAYQSNLVDHLVDAGVISQEAADTFRELNKDYVPFYRYFGEETMSGGLAGSRLKWGNLPKPIKAIRGSTRSIYSPLQSILRNTITMIDIAERNRAARALAELADEAEGVGWLIEEVKTPMQPNRVWLESLKKDLIDAGVPKEALDEADLERIAVTFNPVQFARFKESKENILTIYRNGRPRFYQLHPELYRAMQFLDQPAANWFFRILSTPTRLLRAGAVLNPEFALRNPVRDQVGALMHRKYRFVPVIDPARALFHLIKGEAVGGDELYDKWLAAGGAQSTLVSLNRDYLEADLRKLLGQRTRAERVKDLIRSPIIVLESISQALEEATRLAQFRAGLEAEGPSPEGVRRAAFASREISVDFQRAGSAGRQANQIKAFFNAAIQGTDQLARNWRRDPIGYTLRAFLYITLPSITLYLLNRDDPRYQELPRWRRDLYWPIFGEETVYFIPKPFELGVLFGTLPERILEWALENDPNAFEGLASSLIDTTLPLDVTNPADWLPDAITPLVEVWANREVFTDRTIVPESERFLLPEAQFGPNTSEAAKAIGRLTGTSPRQIDHIIEGYGAGLGQHILTFLDRLAGVNRGDPILQPFGGDPFVSAVSLDEFYRELDQLEREQRTANELTKRGLQTVAQVNDARLRYLRRVRDDLAALRRLNRAILENPNLSVAEKRVQTNAITLRMVNLARMALGKPIIDEANPSQVLDVTSPSM